MLVLSVLTGFWHFIQTFYGECACVYMVTLTLESHESLSLLGCQDARGAIIQEDIVFLVGDSVHRFRGQDCTTPLMFEACKLPALPNDECERLPLTDYSLECHCLG